MWSAKLLAHKTILFYRQNGLKLTAKRIFAVLNPSPVDTFDTTRGTDTSGTTRLWQLTIQSDNAASGVGYQATPEAEFHWAVDALKIEPADFRFIDLGCGKGRTLIMAAEFGFQEVIGVEFAQELAETARRNLLRLGVPNHQIHHSDAAQFRFPDGNLVVYLYNPFGPDVLSKVLDSLSRAKEDMPDREVYLIYNLALWSELVNERAEFAVVARSGHEKLRLWRLKNPCDLSQYIHSARSE